MNVNELDESNRILEDELKRRKLNINNLNKFKSNMSPNSKVKTTANNSSNIKKISINSDKSSIISNRKDFYSPKSNNNQVTNKENKRELSENIRKSYEKNSKSLQEQNFQNQKLTENLNNNNNNYTNTNSNNNNNSNIIYFEKQKTNKKLIPFNFDENSQFDEKTQRKQALEKIKICSKIHLPKEKNYFISEKNLGMLEKAINEKECDINILRKLLDMAKDDIDNYKNRYENINLYIEKINIEKVNLLEDLLKTSEEKKILKENFDEFIDKYNIIRIFNKKIEDIIENLLDMKSMYYEFIENFTDKETKYNLNKMLVIECDIIDKENLILNSNNNNNNNNSNNIKDIASYIKLPEKAEFFIKFLDIIKSIESKEIDVYLRIFGRKKFIKTRQNFFNQNNNNINNYCGNSYADIKDSSLNLNLNINSEFNLTTENNNNNYNNIYNNNSNQKTDIDRLGKLNSNKLNLFLSIFII